MKLRACSSAIAVALATACATPEPLDKGIRIGDETLRQFKINDTSEDWLTAIIGPPTSRTLVLGLPQRTEIFRYSVIESESGGLFSVFTGPPTPRTTATIYFVVRDGLVTQFWADREERPTLLGKKETDTGEKAEK